jgi:prevent-host-death family protein
MKTVTMLEFRQNAQSVLRRVAKGERLLISQRGKPAARLEPLTTAPNNILSTDLFSNDRFSRHCQS